MDLKAAMSQFYDGQGNLKLAPQLSLVGLAELLYQGDLHTGGADRHCLRFWDFSQSREGTAVDFTRQQINIRIKTVAARLQQVAKMGDRVAILMGNSPEYIFGFVGAMYAGMVPVPLYDPNEPGHEGHLTAVFADCGPKLVLTNRPSAAAVRDHFKKLPARERPRILAVDSLPDSLADSYVNPQQTIEGQQRMASSTVMPIDEPAFLQYTSGSTRTPAGVELTNRSILTNVLQIFEAARLRLPLRLVSWLPLHHDMGIILNLFATIMGLRTELMSPKDFIQQPSRWTRMMSAREGDDHNGVYSVIPNFALDLAVRYGNDDDLDFSNINGIIIGSEPVTVKALNSFLEAFEPKGLTRRMLRPSYGLAEASLMVTTPQTEDRPKVKYFDRDQISAGKAVETGSEDGVAFISNGEVVRPQFLTIVDPETKAELPDSTVGEVWCHGDNMAAGYLNRPEETTATFHNTIGERLDDSRAADAPADNWMATGDLGVIIDGELYITGRLKDMIIIAGRNHYPQDIEHTVMMASEHVRSDSVAAFAITADNTEELVLLVERADNAEESGDQQAIQDIRAEVTARHGVRPYDIQFLAPGELSRSSAGKIARQVAKKKYEGSEGEA